MYLCKQELSSNSWRDKDDKVFEAKHIKAGRRLCS